MGEIQLSLRQHPPRHAHTLCRRNIRGLARVRTGSFNDDIKADYYDDVKNRKISQ